MVISSSQSPQVFINFSNGKNDLLHIQKKNIQLDEFVSYLVQVLKKNKINVCVDMDEFRSLKVPVQLRKIEQSKIALVIFSGKYTESISCLTELAKINECVEKGKLVAIPIFFKLDASTVKELRGQFGDIIKSLRVPNETKSETETESKIKDMWKEALQSISNIPGYEVDKKSPNPCPKSEFFKEITEDVKRKIGEITLNRSQTTSMPENTLNDGYIRNYRSSRIKQSLKIFCLVLITCSLQHLVYMSPTLNNKKTDIKVRENENTFFNSTFNNSSIHDGKVKPPNIQVFINFRGAQLRRNFISFLVDALQRNEINVFIDNHEQRGEDLNSLFKRIEGSGIAIVVFSSRYTESKWCLDELVKIKERANKGRIKVVPIYYKVKISNVKRLKGDFGDHFRDQEHRYKYDQAKINQWKEAIRFVSQKYALSFDETSTIGEADFVGRIVDEVLRILQNISIVKSSKFFR